MSLIFSSGGGRLGNQLLNLMHLSAISFEYNINVYKISDLFICGKNKSLLFKIQKNNVNWQIIDDHSEITKIDKLFLKLFIRIIHFYFYFSPNCISYRIGLKNNLPKFIIGKNLKFDFSLSKLLAESKKYNIALSGWGFRDWDLVIKHKETIIKDFYKGFSPLKCNKKKIKNDYLFVHIRRSDFLEIQEYKDLNFTDKVWLKSIIKICEIESITKVVIFSDCHIDDFMISFLKSHKIQTLIKNTGDDKNCSFLKLFVYYLSNAKSVICNASTLVLSISFLYHEKIYLPSKENYFQNVFLNDAHNTYPISLNWK